MGVHSLVANTPSSPANDDPQSTVAASLAQSSNEIEAKLSAIETAAVSAAGGIGFGKRIGEGTNIAVERISDVARHDGLRSRLANVRRAEEKLTAGSAGRCDDCGEVISPERLEALPWAVRCVDCAV